MRYLKKSLLFLLAGALGSTALRADDRPNILWIYLEDVSGWFSCYGDTVIETPNIDAVAASGIRFDRFYTPAGVCSTTRSAIITGMMQTSIGAHNHRSCRPDFRGMEMGEYDRNPLPEGVTPLPVLFQKAGYYTFNEGGKDDYNFEFSVEEFYNHIPKKKGWGPAALVAGECWAGRAEGQPFFGQVQLGGGKLGKRAPTVTDRNIVPVPPYYPDIEEVREEIAHHYDCLLETDRQVGDIMAALKRDGLYENTLIFMFSDHGYKLHRHKQLLYEGGIQMPLIVAGPGVESGKVRKDLVSGIDVSAATLAAAGLDLPAKMEGRDFLASDHEPREFVISARDRCDYTIEHIRAVVTPRFKYLRNYSNDRPWMQPTYKDPWPVSIKLRELMAAGAMNGTQMVFFDPDGKPEEELYDLQNDPHEIYNLAQDPRFAPQLNAHREILETWITESGDQGASGESELGLLCTMKRWGEKCVNPEYDAVRAEWKEWAASQPVKEKKRK
ncbi:MAG: sulfatase [Verrucomicrobiota bacterium]